VHDLVVVGCGAGGLAAAAQYLVVLAFGGFEGDPDTLAEHLVDRGRSLRGMHM
jgi:hypothetical protein